MTNIIVEKSSGVWVEAKRSILKSVAHRKSHREAPCSLKGTLRQIKGGVWRPHRHSQGSRVVLVVLGWWNC